MDVRSLVAAIAVATYASRHVRSAADGSFQVTGPPQTFTFAPNTCTRILDGSKALDLFRADPADDTELVVTTSEVHVRLPHTGTVIRLQQSDCHTLDVVAEEGKISLGDHHDYTGHVTLDCERPEIGHVVGTATFTCYP